MKFYKMKALMLGTVVGMGFNKEGETITDVIVHVDPDNDRENGRYQTPVVTADVAKKLEDAHFAEKVSEASVEDVILQARGLNRAAGSAINFDAEADRHAENMEADESVPQPTTLSTRDTTNFSNRDDVAGDIAGTADQSAADADAAPAPKPAKPKAGAAAAQ